MIKILIVDDQDWVINFYSKILIKENLEILTTGDIDSVYEKIISYNPGLVLINLDLKNGASADVVFLSIKMKYQDLPILIVSPCDTYMYNARNSQANACFIKGCVTSEELIQKIDNVLNRSPDDRVEMRSSFLRNDKITTFTFAKRTIKRKYTNGLKFQNHLSSKQR